MHIGIGTTVMAKKWYKAPSFGPREWEPIEVDPGSWLENTSKKLVPEQVYEDGFGNMYKYELVGD